MSERKKKTYHRYDRPVVVGRGRCRFKERSQRAVCKLLNEAKYLSILGHVQASWWHVPGVNRFEQIILPPDILTRSRLRVRATLV